MGHVPDEDRFPCLSLLFMDPPGRDPLLRSFERHLYAEDRSSPHRHHLLSSPCGRPAPSSAASYHKVLKIHYGWLAEEEEIPVNPMAK